MKLSALEKIFVFGIGIVIAAVIFAMLPDANDKNTKPTKSIARKTRDPQTAAVVAEPLSPPVDVREQPASNPPVVHQNPTAVTQRQAITGEVFIVTQARITIPLPLVDVWAIPASAIKTHIEAKKLDMINQAVIPKNNLQQHDYKIESAKRASDLAYNAMMDAMKAHTAASKKALSDLTRSRVDEANVLKDKTDALESEYEKAKTALSELESQRDEYQEKVDYAESRARLFDQLPDPVNLCATDSAGRFSMTLPGDQAFVLVAVASRDVFGAVEHYYWIIPVTGSKVTLSNDNML